MDDKESEVEEFADCVKNIKELGIANEETSGLHAISLHALFGTKGHRP